MAEPWAATLTGLKKTIEEQTMEKVFEIYIKTTPERLWQALTDPQLRKAATRSASVFSPIGRRARATRGVHPGGGPMMSGENLEVDPPRRLVQSFEAKWSEDVAAEGTSRVTWEIEPVGDSCRLLVTHDQLREGANDELYGGWPMILSGLKTLAGDRRGPDNAGLADVRPGRRLASCARPGSPPARAAFPAG